jgi:Flp pilus assembly protein TadG
VFGQSGELHVLPPYFDEGNELKMQSPRATKSRAGHEKGQAMVEFLLSLMLLMIFVILCFEGVLLLYTTNVLADAAKEGVRYAVVNGSNSASPAGPSTGASSDCTTNITPVKNVVSNFAGLSFHDVSAMTVSVCYLDGNNVAPSRVQVTLSYVYKPWFNVPMTPTISAAAEGRIVN